MAGCRRFRWQLIAALVVIYAPVVIWFGVGRPYLHDELHFSKTIEHFAEQPNLETLRTYPEMSTPLPFVVYAAWGKVAGLDPAGQRTLSLIVGLATWLMVFQLACEVLHDARRAFWLTLFIAVHPYMVCLSVLVYTDMLTIFFCCTALLAFHRRSSSMLSIALAGALLCRQYAVCYTIAVCGVLMVEWWQTRRPEALRLLAAATVSIVPFVALVLFWGGITPANQRFDQYVEHAFTWHPSSMVLYVALLSIYLWPALVFRLRRFYASPKRWIAAGLLGLTYLAFPVRTSPASEIYGATGVGFFDRAVQMITPAAMARDAAFMIGFVLGLPVLLGLLSDAMQRLRDKRCDTAVLLNMVVIVFLLVMPLSSFHWEKYFMMILPAACLAILLPADEAGRESEAPGRTPSPPAVDTAVDAG